MRGVKTGGVLLAAALLVVGCGKRGDTVTNSTEVDFGERNDNRCAVVVVINGQQQKVSGSGGSTITVGNTTITFSPDCSATITKTETAP